MQRFWPPGQRARATGQGTRQHEGFPQLGDRAWWLRGQGRRRPAAGPGAEKCSLGTRVSAVGLANSEGQVQEEQVWGAGGLRLSLDSRKQVWPVGVTLQLVSTLAMFKATRLVRPLRRRIWTEASEA